MLPTLFFLATMQGSTPPSLTAPEILERMVQADNGRTAALAGYSGVRRYRFDNLKSGKHAELTVRMSRGSDGVKTFEIVAETGSGFVRDHILRKMIEAEVDPARRGNARKLESSPKTTTSVWLEPKSRTVATAMSSRSIPRSQPNSRFAAESGWTLRILP